MSENTLRLKHILIKMFTLYTLYMYWALVMYLIFHKLFDNDAFLVSVLLAIPLILFMIFIEKHVE